MSHRNPTDDPEDEDLDDLDDILPTFSKPAPAPPPSNPTHTKTTAPASNRTTNEPTAQDGEEDVDPEFEAELARGMESLLRELGMGGPTTNTGSTGPSTLAPNQAIGEPDEAQMQALLDKLLSGNMDDLDLDSFGMPPSDSASKSASTSKVETNGGSSRPPATVAAKSDRTTPLGTSKDQGLSFEETIERTMRNLKEGADDAKKSKPAAQDPLMALLAQLTSNPNALGDLDLDGLDLSALSASLGLDGKAGGALGEGGDEGMGGVLDGMMRGLMTKEILMEPLEELAEKYPPYLAAQRSNPTIPPTQLSNYETQSQIISQILELFRRPGYSDDDEEKRKEVYQLMCRMQEMGSPPEEVMGEMPEGLGFGDEACTIM